jgi:hypothetical protein
VLERVEHPHHEAGEGEQRDDREHQLRQRDREAGEGGVGVEAGREHGHDPRRGENERERDPAEPEADQRQKSRGDAKGLASLSLLEQLGEDRDEGALQGGVGEQGPDQVGDLEGDRERRHGPGDAEQAGRDDLPHQAGHARETGGEREEGGREGEAPTPGRRRGLARLGAG